jgi:hypothetical protein
VLVGRSVPSILRPVSRTNHGLTRNLGLPDRAMMRESAYRKTFGDGIYPSLGPYLRGSPLILPDA